MECSKPSCKNSVPQNDLASNGLPHKKIAAVTARHKRKWEEESNPPPRQAPAVPQSQPSEDRQPAGNPNSSDEEDMVTNDPVLYEDSNSLLRAIQDASKKSKTIVFFGSYHQAKDPLVDENRRVEMTIDNIWKTTGYRFTVKDHPKLQNGYKTRLWCCQDDRRKKKAKPSQKPDAKHCDHVGMQRYDCRSLLHVSCTSQSTCGTHIITIQLHHHQQHKPYYDVAMPPEAAQIVRDNTEWSTPVSITPKVLWKKDPVQLTSAQLLLQELQDNIDFVLGEYDNAGFPLSYCVLSTKRVLTTWVTHLCDTYGVKPVFSHVDKYMAEIGMLRNVWATKIQLCWWHLRRAVQERLAKNKLSTTPYNAHCARVEFPFIDGTFVPPGKSDAGEYKGGAPDSYDVDEAPCPSPNTIPLHIPRPKTTTSPLVSHSVKPKPQSTHDMLDHTVGDMGSEKKLTIKLLPRPINEQGAKMKEEKFSNEKRTFCPDEFREAIVNMMEEHLCAHPLIPGYSHPSRAGIREWAVKQMHQFCTQNDLQEVWAYLWENWYCAGRWELWACSCYHEIPVLKTTMILESHDESDDDGIVDLGDYEPGQHRMMGERLIAHANLLREFADGLLYQVQFNDHRWAETLECEGASLFRLASSCLDRERRFGSTRGTLPTTWERATTNTYMFSTFSAGCRR
ncbi:hypothetical protein BDN67DRAFT_991114 [Paxillus ammoniavirescens]|nr:hypothetical protein BDN67DRAFT_991114 [Paxillus ammoniavirescens]